MGGVYGTDGRGVKVPGFTCMMPTHAPPMALSRQNVELLDTQTIRETEVLTPTVYYVPVCFEAAHRTLNLCGKPTFIRKTRGRPLGVVLGTKVTRNAQDRALNNGHLLERRRCDFHWELLLPMGCEGKLGFEEPRRGALRGR